MKRGPGVAGRALFALHALSRAADRRLGRRHYRRPPRPKHTKKENVVGEETLAEARPTLEALQAQKATKEQEAKTLTETLQTMWAQRQKGELPKEQYPDYLYNEDQLRVTLQELDRLEPQLRFAEAEAKGTGAKAHHDTYCAPITAQSEKVLHCWEDFIQECAVLVEMVDDQVGPLTGLARADNQPMFELDGGAQTLENMLRAFKGQPSFLPQSVIPYLKPEDRMNVGQARTILGHVKGREPFSETNIQRFLNEYRYEEPKPDVPVEDFQCQQ
jgi:hypothetical protein